jgi:hypothetical protein
MITAPNTVDYSSRPASPDPQEIVDTLGDFSIEDQK